MMQVATYEDLVRLLKSNAVVQALDAQTYYGDELSCRELNQEALNVITEFVMAVPDWCALVQNHFAQWEDDLMCGLWLMDDVLEDAVQV